MQTIIEDKKVPVPFTEGEMTSCYDECKECRCPDCFLLNWYGISPDSSHSTMISVNAIYDHSVYN